MPIKQAILTFIICILSFNATNFASQQTEPNDKEISEVFNKHNVQGTLVLASLDNKSTYIHNHERANKRLSPASTFKILNSIIALEEAIIKDQYEIIKWDGNKRFFDSWNKDHNMKSAFKVSCIWFYQELAKKIGKENYLRYFNKFNYGNKQIGDDITTFWLGKELKITPLEQIEFLKKIYKKKYDISKKSYLILEDIMLVDSTDNYKLYAKTGSTTQNGKGHGWYVGYVTTKANTWFFATNLLIDGYEDLKKRKEITIAVLKKKGLI